jgi:uncharacterized membrane protein YgdD (TMEM256/DUF423 family)
MAAALGFIGVSLGAFGAHALRARLGLEGLEIWRTAVLYHLVHAAALLGITLCADRLRASAAVAWMFMIGILFFSGSLYLLALFGWRWLGPVTPLGGAAFLAGWLTLTLTGVRR